VKQHGGLITVASEPGKGTTFSIYFPAAQAAVQPLAPARARTAYHGSETILVAEDDEPVRRYTVRVLTRAGYQVRIARDGEEAVRLFQGQPDDVALAVLDVIMPKMSGKAAADRIKKIRPDLPILFTTGYDFHLLEVDLIPEMGRDIVQKPFPQDELLGRVRAMIDAR
jgi:DNA-binding response OmpR family regulator